MECNKKIFKSQAAAKKFGRRRGTWLSKAQGRIRIYYCGRCKGWHITTQTKDKGAR